MGRKALPDATVQVASRVTPLVKAALKGVAAEKEWTESQLIRKLIESSAPIKAALKNGKKK